VKLHIERGMIMSKGLKIWASIVIGVSVICTVGVIVIMFMHFYPRHEKVNIPNISALTEMMLEDIERASRDDVKEICIALKDFNLAVLANVPQSMLVRLVVQKKITLPEVDNILIRVVKMDLGDFYVFYNSDYAVEKIKGSQYYRHWNTSKSAQLFQNKFNNLWMRSTPI